MVGFNPWRVKTGRSVGGDIKPHEVTPVTKILRVQYMWYLTRKLPQLSRKQIVINTDIIILDKIQVSIHPSRYRILYQLCMI